MAKNETSPQCSNPISNRGMDIDNRWQALLIGLAYQGNEKAQATAKEFSEEDITSLDKSDTASQIIDEGAKKGYEYSSTELKTAVRIIKQYGGEEIRLTPEEHDTRGEIWCSTNPKFIHLRRVLKDIKSQTST